MEDEDWPIELINLLNQLTRVYTFDWEKVSTCLRDFVKNDHLKPKITAEICRRKFAQSNSVQIPDTKEDEETSETPSNDITKITAGGYENLTIEELMETVARNEANLKIRKEQIFQRVLDSLGGDNSESVQLLTDPAISAYQESLRKKEQLEKLKRQREDDIIERQKFEKEREQLKKRFEPDSEDAVGEYPAFDSNVTSNVNYESEMKLQIHQSGGAEETSFINQFSINSLLEHEEFDRILSELEKELDSQAIGKEEGKLWFHLYYAFDFMKNVVGSLSELGEVLQFLDISADNREKLKQTATQDETIESAVAFPPLPPRSLISKLSHPTNQAGTFLVEGPDPKQSSNAQQVFQVRNNSELSCKVKKEIAKHEIRETDSNEDSDDDEDDLSWRKRRTMMKLTTENIKQVLRSENVEAEFVAAKNPHISNVPASRVVSEPQEPEKYSTDLLLTPASFSSSHDTRIPNVQPIENSEMAIRQQENIEVMQKNEILLDEILPVIDNFAIPESTGSLLNAGSTRRMKDKKK
jgi:hypothetical protein